MSADMPFEWFILLLRVVFIFLLYFFVFQVVRVMTREMRFAAGAGTQSVPVQQMPSGALSVEDPGESNLYAGQILPLDPVTIIGRDRRATIPVEHSFISAEHTQISWQGGQWWVSDLRSTNGTWVNGNQISVSTAIQPGDEIRVGDVRLRLLP
jgi:pSer/pThr/pTyr-binding forkhead associated (FHA) protein